MLYSELGKTGLRVSCLCVGSLAFGSHRGGLSVAEAGTLLERACNLGVNFFDSAEFYNVYPHLEKIAGRQGIVIAGRSYASDGKGMKESVEAYRRGLDRDVVDVFGLHEQESGLTLKGHGDALKYLQKAKSRGIVRAVSVSTHHVACVRAAAMHDDVDVIFAILNVRGLGIVDGRREDMEEALAFAREVGKGVYIMKALGGGHLYASAYEALSYAANFPHKDSVAVGVKSPEELLFAKQVLCKEEVDPVLLGLTRSPKRRLVVQEWCQGCGECVRRCGFGALRLNFGKAEVDASRCMLCGYCARACPHFCLKVV